MSDRPINRRRFFREGLRELLAPLADLATPLEEAARQFAEMEQPSRAAPSAIADPLRHWLRPPGALGETDFLSTCSRCGDCARVCPAQAIRLDATGDRAGGAPYIDADAMPCVACDGLYCMSACGTGALVPVPLAAIDMGTAEWREHVCLRSSGQECTICIDQCPLGAAAIELVDGKVAVHEQGCIGCGVCQKYCPTTPRSIVIVPASARPPAR